MRRREGPSDAFIIAVPSMNNRREFLTCAFTLQFPSGVLAHGDRSFATSESRRCRVHCTEGWIEMDPAFSYRGLRLRTKR